MPPDNFYLLVAVTPQNGVTVDFCTGKEVLGSKLDFFGFAVLSSLLHIRYYAPNGLLLFGFAHCFRPCSRAASEMF